MRRLRYPTGPTWRRLFAAVVGVSLLVPCVIRAQGTPRLVISADTGVFLPGHQDFTRYTTPGWCRAAARNTRGLLRRTLEIQAVIDTLRPAQDTMGASGAAAIAATCGARFALAGIVPSAVSDLFELAVTEANDSLAQAVLAHALTLVQTSAARDTLRMEGLASFLAAIPPRLTAAKTLVAQLDALGPAALSVRLQAHDQLLAFWQQQADSARSRREAEQIVALGRTLPAAEQAAALAGPVKDAYHTLVTLAFLTHPDSMAVLTQQYTAAGGHASLAPGAAFGDPVHARWDQLSPFNSADQGTYAKRTPRPFPTLQGAYWFPAGADQPQPVPGKVNLYLEAGGATWATRVRRWLAQYGTQGLVVTYVVPTHGFSWSLGDFSILNGPWTAAEEATQIAWYLRDYEHLPVTVAVQETHFQWRPAPDGRRIQADTTPFTKLTTGWAYPGGDEVVLVGRDGAMLWRDAIQSYGIETFETLLAWAVAQPVPTAARPPVAVTPAPVSPSVGHGP